MKTVINTKTTYVAIDGEQFATEQACRDYESRLPLHLVFCLEKQIPKEIVLDDAEYHWEVGYTAYEAHTEYEPPGFLREGGEYTVTNSHDMVTMRLVGSFSDALSHALTSQAFLSRWKNAFLRKVIFTKV